MVIQLQARHFKGTQWLHMHDCPIYNALKEKINTGNFGVGESGVFLNSTTYPISPLKLDSKVTELNLHTGYRQDLFNKDMRTATAAHFGNEPIRLIEIKGLND
jgi:hypothetical protein